MYITLTKIDKDADMGGYDAIEITGKRLDNNKTWSKPFFANNSELENKLSDFTVGEDVNVVMEQGKKNPKFWNIVDFKEVSEEEREMAKTPYDPSASKKSGSSKGTGGGGSDKMSKAEWAEKDRVKSLAIARAVALKAAVDNTKVGTTATAIFVMADSLLPYLLGEEKIQGGDDGLNPPE